MATWVAHLMIADGVLKQFPELDRRGFCVANIAPDCKVVEQGTHEDLMAKNGFWPSSMRCPKKKENGGSAAAALPSLTFIYFTRSSGWPQAPQR